VKGGLEGRPKSSEYLVEVYVSGRAVELERIAARAAKAAEELEREGKSIRYLRSIYVPEEETCFHLYVANSVAEVREASERAGIHPERVAAAIQAEATRHAAARRAPKAKEGR
jgi:muconolactone delta-isomerase